MKDLTTLSLALALGACAAPSEPGAGWDGELRTWGTLREALRDGRDEGRVDLAEVARPGVWGVGALAELRGEITIADGEVWLSEGSPSGATTVRTRAPAAEATFLYVADVERWVEVPVEEDVDPSVLDAFVAERAREAGLDPARPFPFVVEGTLLHLDLHVIAGSCPIRARMLGRDPADAAWLVHADRTDGRLVGIHAPDSAGIVCHAGSTSHVHALIDRDGGLTGHVEWVGVARGSTLRLPASRALRGPSASTAAAR